MSKAGAEGFSPELQEESLFLNMKDFGTPSYLTKDDRRGKIQVRGAGLGRVSFESGNPSVATVSQDGAVTAVSGGSAPITVTAESVSGEKRQLTAWAYVRDETAIRTPVDAYEPVNFDFDYGRAINGAPITYKSAAFTTSDPAPEIEALGIRARDEEGADGVRLITALDAANETDLYLGAFVAGHMLRLEVPDGAAVRNILPDGAIGRALPAGRTEFLVKMAPFSASDTATASEQRIEIAISGKTYVIHTKPEVMPNITSYRTDSSRLDAGVYTFALDHFLVRVNTDRQVIYYRDMRCVNAHAGRELLAKNFRPQNGVEDGRHYYTYFIELDPTKRNLNGGFLSGMNVIMDSDYREIGYVTLLPNADKGHGEGYVDQHEFRLLGAHHWLSLSFIQARVDNIPASVPTREGRGIGYVQAGIVQEVKDGKVIGEFNTTDHPIFYETAMEGFDYVRSTDEGMEVTDPLGRKAFSVPDGFRDYTHINSICIDPSDGDLVISMRHQYSVCKIDRATGRIIWTLGGLNDDFGLKPEDKFIGQHCVSFEGASPDERGSQTLLAFDNHTSFEANETRVAEIRLDSAEKAVAETRFYPCAPLDALSGAIGVGEVFDPIAKKNVMPMHWSTHCGSVARQASAALVIGWGLHGVYSQVAEEPLIPLLTEYDPEADAIAFELYVTRNAHYTSKEMRFSYRAYKDAY